MRRSPSIPGATSADQARANASISELPLLVSRCTNVWQTIIRLKCIRSSAGHIERNVARSVLLT